MVTNFINHISIKGYRSIRELDLDLTRLTVLVGANGAGKSNFIDFFAMLNSAFASTTGNLQLFVARSGGASSLLFYRPRVTTKVGAEVSLTGIQYQLDLEWGASDGFFFAREAVLLPSSYNHMLSARPIPWLPGRRESTLLSYGPTSDDMYGPIQNLVSTFGNICTYHFHDTGKLAEVRTSQDTTGPVRLAPNAANLSVLLNYLRAKKPAHYRRILSTVQFVAPFVKDFVVAPESSDDRFVMLNWMDTSGEIFGPHELSDGTIRAIALITALQQPEEMMPSIMVFDEPELGLHPSAIQLVSSLLKAASAKRQIIVATQSPVLIREYAPEDVVVVERMVDEVGRGESIFTRLDKQSLEAWLEDYDLGELYEKNVTGGYPR